MKQFFNNIRMPKYEISIYKKILITICILILGIIFGTFSKYLDYHQGNLPYILKTIDEQLDFHNFLGRFSIWIFIAVCISIYSNSAFRAALNVFVFFVGMVSSYYIYSKFIAGFFPMNYALIWIGFTIISPILAFLCWYAKGSGKYSCIISAGIIAVLFNTTFAYGLWYFDIKYLLELIIFLLTLIILHRTLKETIIVLIMAIVIAFIFDTVVPWKFW